jgi:hypothetical protein
LRNTGDSESHGNTTPRSQTAENPISAAIEVAARTQLRGREKRGGRQHGEPDDGRERLRPDEEMVRPYIGKRRDVAEINLTTVVGIREDVSDDGQRNNRRKRQTDRALTGRCFQSSAPFLSWLPKMSASGAAFQTATNALRKNVSPFSANDRATRPRAA